MATVTVILPPLLEEPDAFWTEIRESARLALDAELPSVLGEIAASGQVPHNLGMLTRAVAQAAQPARIVGNSVVAEIVAAGEVAAYAAVQDLGRRAGKPMSWRFLYYAPGQNGVADAWRGGWVNRKHRDWVVEVANVLRGQDAAKAKKKGRGRRDAATYERRAAYLLAVSVASAIRARGMKGKRFIAGNRDLIVKRCTDLVKAEIARVVARWSA